MSASPMPTVPLVSHLIFALIGAGSAACLRSRAARIAVGILGVLLCGTETLLNRALHGVAAQLVLREPDAVFWTNLSVPGAGLLAGLLWNVLGSAGRSGRWRGGVLGTALLVTALWSQAWYFRPLPDVRNAGARLDGFCPQSSAESCAPAAAVALLHQAGIPATEREMAALCLTRAGLGTPPLGLCRGVAIKARTAGRRATLARPGSAAALARRGRPAILGIAIRPDVPADIRRKMLGYGWTPGISHTVVVLDADPRGAWLDIVDPSYGRERWPTRDLEYIWDGDALLLEPNPAATDPATVLGRNRR